MKNAILIFIIVVILAGGGFVVYKQIEKNKQKKTPPEPPEPIPQPTSNTDTKVLHIQQLMNKLLPDNMKIVEDGILGPQTKAAFNVLFQADKKGWFRGLHKNIFENIYRFFHN